MSSSLSLVLIYLMTRYELALVTPRLFYEVVS